jgi:pimeloyl-ACP methyl ester carboxylesterase
MAASPHDRDPGQTRSHLLRAGDVELHVVERGQGMPIVMLHGFPLDHTMWDAQLNALAEQWRVIAPDLRGFGKSAAAGETATMEQMADDVAGALDTLGVREPVVLVGLSMGGYVAFQFLRKYPDRLKALVLCDTRSIADSPEAAAGRHKLAEQVLREGMQPVADAMLPKLFAPATVAGALETIEAARRTILQNRPAGIAAALRGMAERPDVSAELPRISVPTLVIVGQEDAISTVDEMRKIAKAIPRAEFVVLPRSGHMTPVENSAAFNEAIEPFLTRVERGEAR